PKLVRAFNHLREAIVVIPTKGRRTFASVYNHLVDSYLTDPFITALYDNVERKDASLSVSAGGTE
ncbi:MAG: hypothetical protein GY832_20400, partial [Chloroflexi bacterium]|nr:hypothetical protein [Chloroflexota bacterium]